MKTWAILLVFQGFFLKEIIDALEITSFIDTCSAKDPKLNDCVKEMGQKFLPQLANGVSEWNIPSIDPVHTPVINFKQTENGNDLTVEYKNVIQKGFSSTIIELADVDLAHGVMNFRLKYPFITFEADYKTDGKFLDFKLHGEGRANITVWNAYSSVVLKFRVVNDHIKQYSLIFGFSFDKIFLDYTNFRVNDDDELSRTAGTFINENANVIIEGFKPELEKYYSGMIEDFLQILFDKVPYSVLFRKE